MVPNHCLGCHRTMYHFSITHRARLRPIGPELGPHTGFLLRVCRAGTLFPGFEHFSQIRKDEKWIKGKWVDAQGFLEASTSKDPLHIVLFVICFTSPEFARASV